MTTDEIVERSLRVAELGRKMMEQCMGAERDECCEALLLNLMFVIWRQHAKCCCKTKADMVGHISAAIAILHDNAKAGFDRSQEKTH